MSGDAVKRLDRVGWFCLGLAAIAVVLGFPRLTSATLLIIASVLFVGSEVIEAIRKGGE